MFQESELFNLILSIISLLFLVWFRKARTDLPSAMLIGFYFLVAGNFATVLEGYAMPFLLNLAEHVAFAASGIFFTIGCLSLARNGQDTDSPHAS